MSEYWRSVPNILTTARLLLIPVFVLLMVRGSQSAIYTAVAVFIIASLTDLCDGYIARKWGAVSDFGKLFDPLADKILVMSALIMLVAQRSQFTGEPWVPGWIVVLILAREIWVTGIRGIAANRGVVMPAGGSGKLKSALQMCAIVFLLFHGHSIRMLNQAFGVVIPCELIGMYLIIISIMFSYFGAIDYTLAAFGGGEAKKRESVRDAVQ